MRSSAMRHERKERTQREYDAMEKNEGIKENFHAKHKPYQTKALSDVQKINAIIRELQQGTEKEKILKEFDVNYRDFAYLIMAFRAVGKKEGRPDLNKRPMMRYLKRQKHLSYEDLARIFYCSRKNIEKVFREEDMEILKHKKNEAKEVRWVKQQNELLKENEKKMDEEREKRKKEKTKKINEKSKKKKFIPVKERVTGSGKVFGEKR